MPLSLKSFSLTSLISLLLGLSESFFLSFCCFCWWLDSIDYGITPSISELPCAPSLCLVFLLLYTPWPPYLWVGELKPSFLSSLITALPSLWICLLWIFPLTIWLLTSSLNKRLFFWLRKRPRFSLTSSRKSLMACFFC